MTPFANGLIECYCGPKEKGAPDDLEQVIVDFIDGAGVELQIAVQELDREDIARALVRAKVERGVRIQLFVEQDYLLEAWDKKELEGRRKPGETDAQLYERLVWGPDEKLPLSENRRLLAALLRASIDTKADLNPAIFHQKFIVRDVRGGPAAKNPKTAVLTGSTNLTENDTHKNLNHIVIFNDQQVAREYYSQFNELLDGDFGRGELGPPVITDHMLEGVPVRVLFSPDSTPEHELVKQMLRVRRLKGQLDFAIFTFSESSAIDEAMDMLARAGCEIRGVLDRAQNEKRDWSGSWRLHHDRIKLFLPSKAWKLRKVHHKLMVIDDHTTIGGSFNYTEDANVVNDENLFVIGSASKTIGKKPVDRDECAKIAAFFRAEIERIITHCDAWEPPVAPDP